MTATQTPERDYVPVDGGKKRLSRGRKALIGLLVFGAVGAAAGGGTFATFTASTDNRSAAAPFEAQNNMVLANTVADATVGTQCRSDEAGAFTEIPITGAADAVRCDVLFTSTEVDALAEGTEISALVALENLSLDENSDGIPGTLMWSSVDEFFAGCVGFDETTDADGADDTFFTADDDYIESGDGDYGDTLCDNIALTIQEVAVDGDRGDTDARDYSATPRDFDTDTFVAIDTPGARCVWPASGVASCATDPAANQRASLLPLDFNPTNEIDTAMEADEDAVLNDYEGVRVFRITANLIGDTICTVSNDADSDGIIDATGQGCSNGADGNAAFTIRWVLQEN